jgi:leader peptidase (prepilin peptidase)/N-methyltransferase
MAPLTIMLLLVQIAVGAVVGSTVTTAAIRTMRGEPWIRGRSHCDNCGCAIGFARTIPLVSFAIARGKCASCNAAISWRHPVGEALGAGIMVSASLARPAWIWPLTVILGFLLLYAAVIVVEKIGLAK